MDEIVRGLQVVLEKQMDERDLELVRGKEASGAGVEAVTEPEGLGTSGHEMCLVCLSGYVAHAHEPRPVEHVRVLVYVGIEPLGGADGALGTLWYDGSVR